MVCFIFQGRDAIFLTLSLPRLAHSDRRAFTANYMLILRSNAYKINRKLRCNTTESIESSSYKMKRHYLYSYIESYFPHSDDDDEAIIANTLLL